MNIEVSTLLPPVLRSQLIAAGWACREAPDNAKEAALSRLDLVVERIKRTVPHLYRG